MVWFTDGTWWTVGIAVGALVRTSASWFTVGRANVLAWRAHTLVATGLADTLGTSVANLLSTIVDPFAAGQWITFEALHAPTYCGMLFHRAVSISAAEILATLFAWVDTLEVGANLFFRALEVVVAFDGTTSEAFIVGIAKVSGQALANGTVAVDFANGISPTNDTLARILAVVEAAFIGPAGIQRIALVVVVASILNS